MVILFEWISRIHKWLAIVITLKPITPGENILSNQMFCSNFMHTINFVTFSFSRKVTKQPSTYNQRTTTHESDIRELSDSWKLHLIGDDCVQTIQTKFVTFREVRSQTILGMQHSAWVHQICLLKKKGGKARSLTEIILVCKIFKKLCVVK